MGLWIIKRYFRLFFEIISHQTEIKQKLIGPSAFWNVWNYKKWYLVDSKFQKCSPSFKFVVSFFKQTVRFSVKNVTKKVSTKKLNETKFFRAHPIIHRWFGRPQLCLYSFLMCVATFVENIDRARAVKILGLLLHLILTYTGPTITNWIVKCKNDLFSSFGNFHKERIILTSTKPSIWRHLINDSYVYCKL